MNAKRTRRAALAAVLLMAAAAASAQQEDARRYVWERLVVEDIAPEAAPLQAQLADEVERILAAGPLAPVPFTVGISGTYVAYANSGELVYALAEALPYLPEAMRPRVIEYMKQTVRRTPPWGEAALGGEGAAWIAYAPQPPEAPSAVAVGTPVVNAYFAWAYADATGDWESVSAAYPALVARATSGIRGAPQTYPQVMATIGLARLARHLGRDADARGAEAMALRGLEAGEAYEAFFMNSYRSVVTGHHDWSYPVFTETRKPAIVTGFAPEIGRMLRDRSLEKVRAHADPVMDVWVRTWYLTRASLPTFFGQYYADFGPEQAPEFMRGAWGGPSGQGDFGQENSYLTPEVGWGLFMLRAYVYGESGADLARHLDVPWTRVGDTYHIQKLVAAIRAHGRPRWVEVG